MANWALVEDGKIQGTYDFLPKNWRNVSGLDMSANDLPFLRSLGWQSVIKKHQAYDPEVYRENGCKYELVKGDVIESLVLIKRDPPPPFEVLKEEFMDELRSERNKRLLVTDWTQLVDVQSGMSDIEKVNWSRYRQELRDLPGLYADNDVVDIDQVVWPRV